MFLPITRQDKSAFWRSKMKYLDLKADYIIKRKIMKNLEDTVLTLIIVIMVFMISNLYKRVKNLEDKIE